MAFRNRAPDSSRTSHGERADDWAASDDRPPRNGGRLSRRNLARGPLPHRRVSAWYPVALSAPATRISRLGSGLGQAWLLCNSWGLMRLHRAHIGGEAAAIAAF